MARRSYQTDDPNDADAFWQDLGQYLINQHHAARWRRWPVGRWLSHGPAAADPQVAAEALAATLGIGGQYEACIENDEGWIAEAARSGRAKLPRQMPCPIGCRTPSDEPAILGNCGHRKAAQQIVTFERARRAAQSAYFAALKRIGRKCCGRVDGCPLYSEIAA